MQEICDIFLFGRVEGPSIEIVSKTICPFQKDFAMTERDSYSGFLGLNIKRLQGVKIVTTLRKHRIFAINVPIKYRDGNLLTEDEAAMVLSNYISRPREHLHAVNETPLHPVYFFFGGAKPLDSIKYPPNEGGGMFVDRLDGHILEGIEMDEIGFDYNNLI